MRPLEVREWPEYQPYVPIWQAMKQHAAAHEVGKSDALWLLEHEPVFTQGLAGRAEHVLNPGVIPVVQSDRGGQVTYHGPGQLMIYTLFDINRLALNTRTFVCALERVIIDCLRGYGIDAQGRRDAPGVYIGDKKVASLGLRVKKGFAYHGVAFNVALCLTPFARINPCGYEGLAMTTINEHTTVSMAQVKRDIITIIKRQFSYH